MIISINWSKGVKIGHTDHNWLYLLFTGRKLDIRECSSIMSARFGGMGGLIQIADIADAG